MLEVVLKDNGEKLIDMRTVVSPILTLWTQSTGWQMNGGTHYGRETAVNMLVTATAKYHKETGNGILVADAWRNRQLQQGFRAKYYFELKEANPEWSHMQILAVLDSWAAPVSGPKTSGHRAGGAFDLYPVTPDGEIVLPKFYKPELAEELKHIYEVMGAVVVDGGFAPLFEGTEPWHFSYGDMNYAKVKGLTETLYAATDQIRPVFSAKEVTGWSDEEVAAIMPALLSGQYIRS